MNPLQGHTARSSSQRDTIVASCLGAFYAANLFRASFISIILSIILSTKVYGIRYLRSDKL